jgi:hypothetical protein
MGLWGKEGKERGITGIVFTNNQFAIILLNKTFEAVHWKLQN